MSCVNEEAAIETGQQDDLSSLFESARDCQNCELGKFRNNLVFGVGNSNADIMLVGEAPGETEDREGKVFVGKAGQLLTKILNAIQLTREDVYVTNILKCRPPNNRNPLPSEIEACLPYLRRQIDVVKPKFILCMGKIAAGVLFDRKVTLGALRASTC